MAQNLNPSTWTRHIFLSGKSGLGKTTLIKNVLAHCNSDFIVSGFQTHFIKKNHNEKTLYISPAKSFFNSKKPVMEYLNGRMTVHSKTFETFGVSLLKNTKKSSLIIMDELGRFENDCELFKSSVFECLERKTPILGVLQIQEQESWLDSIKAHPNVTVLNITEENRNEIEKEIRHTLFNRFEE